jgi:hypothetical protein
VLASRELAGAWAAADHDDEEDEEVPMMGFASSDE